MLFINREKKSLHKVQLKFFLKIFFLLLIFEFSIGLADVLFFQNSTMVFGVKLSPITHFLVMIFSMPISFFGRDLPFYARESWVAIVLTILNILIQSLIIVKLLKTWRSYKTKNPKV